MEVDYIEDEGWLIFVKGFVDDTHFEGPVSFKTSFHEMEGVKETAQVKGLIGNFRFTAFFLQIKENLHKGIAGRILHGREFCP